MVIAPPTAGLAAVVIMTQGVTPTQAQGAALAEESSPEREEDMSPPKKQRRDSDARTMMVSWINALGWEEV